MSLRKFSMSPYYKALVCDFRNGQLSDSQFTIPDLSIENIKHVDSFLCTPESLNLLNLFLNIELVASCQMSLLTMLYFI